MFNGQTKFELSTIRPTCNEEIKATPKLYKFSFWAILWGT